MAFGAKLAKSLAQRVEIALDRLERLAYTFYLSVSQVTFQAIVT